MDARLARLSVVVAALAWSAAVHAASHRTPNFVVEAPTDEIAKSLLVVMIFLLRSRRNGGKLGLFLGGREATPYY